MKSPMKILLPTMLLATKLISGFCSVDKEYAKEEWKVFKLTHGKYYHSKLEEENRFAIFVRNLELIMEHNKKYKEGNASFKLAMNRFGDVLQSELRQAPAVKPRRRFTLKLPCRDTPDGLNVSDLPAEVDWRKEGAVTPVPDQGSCLSSYAFSATGALESQWFRKTGKLVPLSAQNIVDCGAMFHNRNCDGGFMDSTYGYIKVNGGIDSEESYPYVGTKSDCAFDPSGVAATVSSFVNINSATESTLMTKVALVGPVCAFVDNSQSTFTFYSEGVYHDSGCLKDSMRQAVLIVGYGATKDGQKYWIVRNSWGTNWGQDGYILIRRDSDNECGIASFITYPVI